MYQRNDKGQIIGACVLGVFLFFGNMYMSYANTMSVLEEAADYADESYQERNQQILNTIAKEVTTLTSNGVTTTATETVTKTQPVVKPKSSDPKTLAADSAMNTFRTYHQMITDGDISKAYDLLSENYKREGGNSFYDWSMGYIKTKESIVDSMRVISQTDDTIVIQYTLHAEDYTGNKGDTVASKFAGEVTMRKQGSGWLIDDMSARKI